ncbi:MAG: hypothetical protein MHPSP_002571, partial [Paramarteilia canceri]
SSDAMIVQKNSNEDSNNQNNGPADPTGETITSNNDPIIQNKEFSATMIEQKNTNEDLNNQNNGPADPTGETATSFNNDPINQNKESPAAMVQQKNSNEDPSIENSSLSTSEKTLTDSTGNSIGSYISTGIFSQSSQQNMFEDSIDSVIDTDFKENHQNDLSKESINKILSYESSEEYKDNDELRESSESIEFSKNPNLNQFHGKMRSESI